MVVGCTKSPINAREACICISGKHTFLEKYKKCHVLDSSLFGADEIVLP